MPTPSGDGPKTPRPTIANVVATVAGTLAASIVAYRLTDAFAFVLAGGVIVAVGGIAAVLLWLIDPTSRK